MGSSLHPPRTTGLMSSCGSSGMTHAWPTENILMTHWTSILPCWTLSGNQTCSLPMRKGPTSMRWPRTISYCASSRMGMCSTASGAPGGRPREFRLRGRSKMEVEGLEEGPLCCAGPQQADVTSFLLSLPGWHSFCPAQWTSRTSPWTSRPARCSWRAVSILRESWSKAWDPSY